MMACYIYFANSLYAQYNGIYRQMESSKSTFVKLQTKFENFPSFFLRTKGQKEKTTTLTSMQDLFYSDSGWKSKNGQYCRFFFVSV